jgi:SAM-dependent methyltransferase
MAEDLRSAKAHWDGVYAQRGPTEVSWYEPAPEISLALIDQAGLGRDAAIIDVGGGTSGLACALLRDGFSDITVADIAAASLRQAQTAVGADAGLVRWVRADVRSNDFGRRYELWHDRAVFHFMVSAADRDAYLEALRRALRPGGHAVVATFGPDGPTRCSGLRACRYDAEELLRLLGGEFHPVATRLHEHTTPSGGRQQFLYLLAHRTPDP